MKLDRRRVVAAAVLAPAMPAMLQVVVPQARANSVAGIGQPAPAFTGVDTAGARVSLADIKGKTVVLEWVNPHCPYVRKHYDSANMQATQREAVAKGVVWIAINSTNRGHGDYEGPQAMGRWMREKKAAATATLMDTDGQIGRAYGARTTPHLFVIDARGVLVYTGAIDNRPSANPADVAGATNHVKAALAQVLAGQPVTLPSTRAYG